MEDLEQLAEKSAFRRAYEFGGRYIDYRMAALGATAMGAIVFGINYDEGIGPAITAASKQAAVTFALGGVTMRMCERLAVNTKRAVRAGIISVAIPTLISLGATYGVHKIRGTPKPLSSTVPTMVLAPPTFAYWSQRKRNESAKGHNL
ncbi:MAG: hypothetical protein ABH864_03380 [archaeon]